MNTTYPMQKNRHGKICLSAPRLMAPALSWISSVTILLYILGFSTWSIDLEESDIASADTVACNSSDPSFLLARAEDVQNATCGGTKCFLMLDEGTERRGRRACRTTGRAAEVSASRTGYLLAQEGRKINKGSFTATNVRDHFYRAWEVASHIRARYNASSLLLAPPEILKKNATFVDRINRINNLRGRRAFSADAPLVIQKTMAISVPNHYWWFGYNPGADAVFYEKFRELDVVDPDRFLKNLLFDWDQVPGILDTWPCLSQDFQVIVGRGGRIHHIDLDRCFDVWIYGYEAAKLRGIAMNFMQGLIEKYKTAVERERSNRARRADGQPA